MSPETPNFTTPPYHRTKLALQEEIGAGIVEGADPLLLTTSEFDVVVGALMQASDLFVERAATQVSNRAKVLFDTNSPSPSQRVKTVFTHRDIGRTKAAILDDPEAMAMVDGALDSSSESVGLVCTGFPMKVYNPLETNYQGDVVDLGDISVLLRFAEMSRLLTHFGSAEGKKFLATIVSDGRMNMGMFKADPEVSQSYISNLTAMIGRLGISDYVSVQEFFSVLSVDEARSREYEELTGVVKADCHAKFDHLFHQNELGRSIESAIDLEYRDYQTTSFGDLFNSTIGSVRYRGIEALSAEFNLDFLETYASILRSILWDQRLEDSRLYKDATVRLPEPARMDFHERLMQERTRTLQEAWDSTIEYFAVLQANKQMRILESLFPGAIRLTTRPKKGQIGVHTSDQNSPTVFSYHSVPVVVPCSKGKKVKVDFQLRSNALTSGCRPVLLDGVETVFYLHPSIAFDNLEELPWIRGGN